MSMNDGNDKDPVPVYCELIGFPIHPKLRIRDVQEYLPIWTMPVVTIQRIEEGGLVLLELSTEEMIPRLQEFCRQTTSLYQGQYPIHVKVLTTNEKLKRNKNKNKKNGPSKEEIHQLADDFLTHLHQTNHPLITTRGVLSKTFQSYCNDNTTTITTTMTTTSTKGYRRRLESSIMTRMRQCKWMKSSKRRKQQQDGLITVTIVQSDRHTFPTLQERQSMRDQLLQERQEAEQDKYGVSVRILRPNIMSDNTTTCSSSTTNSSTTTMNTIQTTIGQETTVMVELSVNDIEKKDNPTAAPSYVFIDDIEWMGPQAHWLEPVVPETQLPMVVDEGSSPINLKYRIRPLTQIGLGRARLQITLEHDSIGAFVICRSLGISSGNPALQAVLQVQTPYRPRKEMRQTNGGKFHSFASLEQFNTPQRQQQTKNNGPVVYWPETTFDSQKKNNKQKKNTKKKTNMDENNNNDDAIVAENGFGALGKYRIPKQHMDWLQNNELENVLDSFEWSPKTTPSSSKKDYDDNGDDDNNNIIDINHASDIVANTPPHTDKEEEYKSNLKDYGAFWSQLLFANECQSLLDIQMFDMERVSLQHAPGNCQFALTVPGLAEGRPSVLRGDLVNLTWNQQLYKGRVHATQLLQVILHVPKKFASTFNPSLDRVDLVRFTFSRTTFRTSHQACLEYAQSQLGPSMLEPTPPLVEEWRRQRSITDKNTMALSFANRSLNPEQRQAISLIVNGHGGNPLPYIVYGPPGTGKTTCVVEMVYQLARSTQSPSYILLVAPSNDAADILVQRLAQYFAPMELLRVLAYSRNPDSVPTEIRPYTLSNDGDTAADAIEDRTKTAIKKAKIVVATVNLAARFRYMGIPRGHFDVICVDEAGHATEPELVAVAASLLNIEEDGGGDGCGGKLILAGDPQQLGPITTSNICKSYGYEVSLMERLSQRTVYQRSQETKQYPDDLLTKLVRNYRSHPSILKLPNELFYDGELQCCGDMMVTHSMAKWEHLPKPGFPILFHSIKGDNQREGNSPSWFNPEEAQQVVAYVDLLLEKTKPALSCNEIGIITPYARQAQKIRAALKVNHPRHDIKVGSVECFQGQERRVIILSTVRSEPELYVDHDIRHNLGFVAHPKRFNVAITRAKALLIVVGCPSVLALDNDNWLPFLKYCHENAAWVGEPWAPSSTTAADDDMEEAGDEIFVAGAAAPATDSKPPLSASWELVQFEESYAFVNREE